MASQTDLDFGQIAFQNKLITKKQLDEALEALDKLEKSLKGKKQKKKPRLVDVLVQKGFLDGVQAASVEKARTYRQQRIEDKLYARIALKSKFVKQKTIEKGLEAQKKAYLNGKPVLRLSDWLIDEEHLTKEQDKAIREVMAKLDAEKYVAKRSGRVAAKAKSTSGRKSGSEVEEVEAGADEDDVEELEADDVEEIEVEELEADEKPSKSGSDDEEESEEEEESEDDESEDEDEESDVPELDDAEELEDVDSKIDGELKDLDDELEGLDLEESSKGDKGDEGAKGKKSDAPAKKGSGKGKIAATSDSIPEFDLDDDDKKVPEDQSGVKKAKKSRSGEELSDLEDVDLDEVDDDADSEPEDEADEDESGGDDDDDEIELDDLEDEDEDDEEEKKPAGKKKK